MFHHAIYTRYFTDFTVGHKNPIETKIMNKETTHAYSDKIVYFVRHGESVGNAAGVHQSHEGGLSSEGKRQARALAKRFGRISIDVILASTMPRAKETAEFVHAEAQKPIEFSDLLVEVRAPSEIQGKPHTDEKALELRKSIQIQDHKPTWRYADEENFSDRIERASRVVEMLLMRPEKNIVVVSHGTFLRTLLAYMAFGNGITPSEYIRFLIFFHKFNTGISVCSYEKNDFGESRWKLIHWNDVAHLG